MLQTPKSVDSPNPKPHTGKVGVAKKNKRRESLASTARSARSSAELSVTFSPTAAASTSTSARPSRLQQSFTSQSSDVPGVVGGGTLTVPLLSRAYAPRHQRYGPDDASDDDEEATGDIEAGQPQRERVSRRSWIPALAVSLRYQRQNVAPKRLYKGGLENQGAVCCTVYQRGVIEHMHIVYTCCPCCHPVRKHLRTHLLVTAWCSASTVQAIYPPSPASLAAPPTQSQPCTLPLPLHTG